jgi:hypothetical protein
VDTTLEHGELIMAVKAAEARRRHVVYRARVSFLLSGAVDRAQGRCLKKPPKKLLRDFASPPRCQPVLAKATVLRRILRTQSTTLQEDDTNEKNKNDFTPFAGGILNREQTAYLFK